MSSSANRIHKPPHVLISGAGLAGLFLGILLERAGIPFDIYERAEEVKPLGNHNTFVQRSLSISYCRATANIEP